MNEVLVENYGPAFASLLDSDRKFAYEAGCPHEESFRELSGLAISEAFQHTKVTDEDMANLCLAGLWLFCDYLEQSHHISQAVDTPTGSFWHGIMHRREGDFPNAKYWFRQTGEHPVFERLDEQISDNDELLAPKQVANLAQHGYDPFDFVDQCRTVAKTGSSDDDAENELQIYCQEVTRLEWWALFDYCYQQATT